MIEVMFLNFELFRAQWFVDERLGNLLMLKGKLNAAIGGGWPAAFDAILLYNCPVVVLLCGLETHIMHVSVSGQQSRIGSLRGD